MFLLSRLNAPHEYDYSIKFESIKAEDFAKFCEMLSLIRSKAYDPASRSWFIKSVDLNIVNRYRKLPERKIKIPKVKTKPQELKMINLNSGVKEIFGWETMGEEMKLQPYQYQKEIIKFSHDTENVLIVAPCGAGKILPFREHSTRFSE